MSPFFKPLDLLYDVSGTWTTTNGCLRLISPFSFESNNWDKKSSGIVTVDWLPFRSIRISFPNKTFSEISENVSILYGGSVKPDNAKEIFSKPDVDGGLIGGAALNANDFFGIISGI